jgi:hypothetical protein
MQSTLHLAHIAKDADSHQWEASFIHAGREYAFKGLSQSAAIKKARIHADMLGIDLQPASWVEAAYVRAAA